MSVEHDFASRMSAQSRPGGTKTCPECAEDVKAAAHVCRFCGYRFEGPGWPQFPSRRSLPSRRGLLYSVLVAAVVVVLAVLAVRLFEPGSTFAKLAAAVALVVVGLYLWFPHRADPPSKVELGAALVGGAVIAFAILYLQEERELINERQDLELTLSLREDLSGVDLRERELANFSFAGKDLIKAIFRDADLEEARFWGSNLRSADFRGADLSGADLTLTENLELAYLRGAHADSRTKWPEGFSARAAGVDLDD